MLRIIVADDMPMQVKMLDETIRRIRPQDQVFTAQNGEEVLSILQEQRIDLILSDIRMPYLDGLEMLRRVSQISPDTRVIFITGYALFSYAQQALRQGALDFMVKPVETGELREKLDAFEAQLLREREQTLQSKTKHLMLIMRTWLSEPLNQLPAYDQQELREQLGSGWIAAVYMPEPQTAGHEIAADLTFGVLLAREPILLSLPEQKHMLFAVLCGDKRTREPLMACLNRISKRRGVAIGISGYQEDLAAGGFAACADAQRGADEAFYMERSPSEGDGGRPLAVPEFVLPEEMRHWLISGNDYLSQRLDAMLEGLLRQRSRIIQLLETTIYNVARCVEGQIYEEEGRQIVRELAQGIRMVRGWQAYCDLLRSSLLQLSRAAEQAIQSESDPIDQCILHIQNRYMDQISLEEMAQRYALTPNYFSSLFKKRTGRRFVEYLTAVRLERAAELLRETDDFVYQITERCGYMDERYFIRQFRKQYHMSPLAYRRIHRKGQTK